MAVAPLGHAAVEAREHVGAADDNRQQGEHQASRQDYHERQGEREPRRLLGVEARRPHRAPRRRAFGVSPGLERHLDDGRCDRAPQAEPRQEGGAEPRQDGDEQE